MSISKGVRALLNKEIEIFATPPFSVSQSRMVKESGKYSFRKSTFEVCIGDIVKSKLVQYNILFGTMFLENTLLFLVLNTVG